MPTDCVLFQLGNDLCVFRLMISRQRVEHRHAFALRLLSLPSRQENNCMRTPFCVCVCVCVFISNFAPADRLKVCVGAVNISPTQ